MWNSIIEGISPHLLAGSIMIAVMGVMLLVHKLRGAKHKQPDALEILRQRYARGEIDRDEYEERRKVLGTSASDA
ncbi:MAG TPA: SHOCT domain-containing protein [Acetobacteraceae bacterium]|jgi:putative membrane protein|nr:SHOCT domain-containing protein [Acetobacteraceae bacterium]